MNKTQILKDHLVDHLPHIRAIVSRISKDMGVVDDISQECCVRLIEKERLWDGNTHKLNQWMNTVTRNLTLNLLAKKRRKEDSLKKIWAEKTTPSTLTKLLTEEQAHWVVSQFKTLPERQKEVLQLKYYQGMTTQEIANTLLISKQAVSTHITRALTTLRGRAKAQGFLTFIPFLRNIPIENFSLKTVFGGTLLMTKNQKIATLVGMGLGTLGSVAGIKMIEILQEDRPAPNQLTQNLEIENAQLKNQLANLNQSLDRLKNQNKSLILENNHLKFPEATLAGGETKTKSGHLVAEEKDSEKKISEVTSPSKQKAKNKSSRQEFLAQFNFGSDIAKLISLGDSKKLEDKIEFNKIQGKIINDFAALAQYYPLETKEYELIYSDFFLALLPTKNKEQENIVKSAVSHYLKYAEEQGVPPEQTGGLYYLLNKFGKLEISPPTEEQSLIINQANETLGLELSVVYDLEEVQKMVNSGNSALGQIMGE